MDTNFYTIDGKTLKNIEDLLSYIKSCDENIFIYHKEHFARWLIDIFGDCKLALQIKSSKNKENFLKKLEK